MKKIKSDGKDFEVIFCSWDKEESNWKEYFQTMPWLALPYGDKRIKELQNRYNVSGIPTLIIIDPLNNITIAKEGRDMVASDPEGNYFPWEPRACYSQEALEACIDNKTCCIFYDTTQNQESITAFTTVAENTWSQWKSEDVDPLLTFFYGKGDGFGERVKEFLNVTGDPILFIVSCKEGNKYVAESFSVPAQEEDFVQFLEAWKQKTLNPIGLQDPVKANSSDY